VILDVDNSGKGSTTYPVRIVTNTEIKIYDPLKYLEAWQLAESITTFLNTVVEDSFGNETVVREAGTLTLGLSLKEQAARTSETVSIPTAPETMHS